MDTDWYATKYHHLDHIHALWRQDWAPNGQSMKFWSLPYLLFWYVKWFIDSIEFNWFVIFQVAVCEVGDVAERGICVRGSEKKPTNAWPSKATGSSAQQAAGRRWVNAMAHSSKRNGDTRLVSLHTLHYWTSDLISSSSLYWRCPSIWCKSGFSLVRGTSRATVPEWFIEGFAIFGERDGFETWDSQDLFARRITKTQSHLRLHGCHLSTSARIQKLRHPILSSWSVP